MEQSIGSFRLFYISPSSAIAERNNSGIIACGCWYYPQTNNLPTTFIIYPPPSEFSQQLHNLPNTFRIYPTPSDFTQPLQILPNTFRIYQPLQILPNTFRIYPPPSEFTHHLQNLPTTFRIYPPTFRKNRFWGLWTFLYLFWPFCWPQKRPFWQKWIFGKINKLNDHLHKLN